MTMVTESESAEISFPLHRSLLPDGGHLAVHCEVLSNHVYVLCVVRMFTSQIIEQCHGKLFVSLKVKRNVLLYE